MSETKTDFSMGFIFCTVVLTAYSQLIVKWRVSRAGPLPVDLAKKAVFLTGLMLDPWILTAILGVFFAGLGWMAAMTKLELSYAYPFMSLAFVLVLIFSAVLFHEAITAPKVLGMLLIIVGIVVTSRG
ncbi:MAG TPA: EamA family transporter [Pyrinomonadaceae bacterium]|jgi:drug/metabolite transporter (DMT)-like permease